MTSIGDDEEKTRSFSVLAKGTMVGHYRIVEKIGAGGMGEVYLAEDTQLDRKVALKFLPPHLCHDPECRARFTREAQAAAKLDHPNIVAVHEVSEFRGRPFFSMQHVEGQSLKEVLAGKELPLDRIREIGIQICEGLQAAHEKGITHRDIKPTNILIDSHGRARIVDFGLASMLGSEQLTKTGSTLGTVGYMSPEQVRGEQVDHRTDLFSLGVVLYELTTGHSPFKSETEAATFRAITSTKPELLAHFRRDVPAELQVIIDKALEKDKNLRYQHADEMQADLRRIGTEMQPAQAIHKRRRRVVVPTLAVVGLVVLALVLKPWRFEISPTHETQAATNWLAVMYFDNVTDPDDGKRLGQISTNLLITGLSQSKYIQVLSSQRLYDLLKQVGKEGAKMIDQATASQIAKKAEAKWMLTGSILQNEPTIVLTSQLVDVATGGVIASQRVTGNPGENIFAVIDQLTEEVKKSGALPAGIKGESSIPVANVTTNSPEAYRYYLEGVEYWNKYYWEDSKRAIRKAIEYDSTFANAYAMLAVMDMYTNASEQEYAMAQAMKYVDRASDRERQNIMSIHYYLRRDYDKAIAVLRDYLEHHSDDKEFWFVLGELYSESGAKGGQDSCIACLKRVLALDPNYRMAYNGLAYAFDKTGRHKEAIDAINKYIELAPDEANPYDSRGDLYAWSGRLDSALDSYRKALSIKPDYLESLKKKACMEMFLGLYQQAENTFRAYFTSLGKPDRGYWRTSLVYIPMYRGRFRDALLIADQCIAANKLDGMDSTTWPMYCYKSDAYDWLGMPDSPLAMVKMALAVADKEAVKEERLVSYQAIMSFKGGDTITANLLLGQLERDAQSKDAGAVREYWDAKGSIALFAKDYAKAVECLARVDSVSSGMGGSYALAEACLYSGDRQKAIKILEKKLIKFDQNRAFEGPYSVKGYYLLGRAYDEIGEKEKARTALERFLTIWKDADPGIKEVDDAKARLARLKSES